MTPARPSTALRRFVLVALVVPAVLTIAAVSVQLVALPHAPETIAIHWGATGAPDGFGPAWTTPLMTLLVGLGIPLLIALPSLPGLRRGDRGVTYRLMGAVAAGTSALSAVLFTWTLLAQVGLDDPAEAPSVLPAMLWGFAIAILVGAAAWFVQPKEAPYNSTAVAAAPLELAPGEHAAWFGEAIMARGAIVAIVAACILMAGAALFSWVSGAPLTLAAVLSVVAIVLIGAVLTTTAFRVRVDDEGLTVVSVAGFPRFRIPLAEVRNVAVKDVNPMGEFGGAGIRSAPGRLGIVLRRGEAIEVERASGRRFVVTVDDAATAAGLLRALADRAAASARADRG